MSPKTWMRKVYFQRYLKLEKLARLGVGYLMYLNKIYDDTWTWRDLLSVDHSAHEWSVVVNKIKT